MEVHARAHAYAPTSMTGALAQALKPIDGDDGFDADNAMRLFELICRDHQDSEQPDTVEYPVPDVLAHSVHVGWLMPNEYVFDLTAGGEGAAGGERASPSPAAAPSPAVDKSNSYSFRISQLGCTKCARTSGTWLTTVSACSEA